ncbi:MAG: hypothetical protein ABIG73_01260 [Patescibacteria group bacterium]
MKGMKEALESPGKLKTKKVPAVKVADITVPQIRWVQATAKKEDITKIAANIDHYLKEISGYMADSVRRIREIQSAPYAEWILQVDELKKLEDEVVSHLTADGGPLLTAARQAYASAMVSTLPIDKKVVLETIKGGKSRLPGLIRIGVLEPVEEAKKYEVTVRVYGEAYKVIGNKEFGMKIADALSSGAAKAAKAGHDKYHGAVAELKTQATITVVELLRRKPGKFFLNVPDLRDGEKFLPGGALLAESDGEDIWGIQAIGHFSRIMGEIAEAEAFVSIASLSQDRLNLAKRLPEDAFRRIRILHAVIRRGLADEFARQKPTITARPAETLAVEAFATADLQSATIQ